MSENASISPAALAKAVPNKLKQRTIFCPSQRAKDEAERFSMSGEQYLERYHIRDYLEDIVKLLVECRDENPLNYLHRYFKCCNDGNNVLLREFEYINATPRNRLAFVSMFQSAYSNFNQDHMITLSDYHQLLLLLCPDFPVWVVHKAYEALAPKCSVADKAASSSGMHTLKFSELKQYVDLFFVFAEFLDNVNMTFKVLSSGSNNGAVELHSLLWSIKQLSAQNGFSCPDMQALDELMTESNVKMMLDEHEPFQAPDASCTSITYWQFVHLLTRFSLLAGSPERTRRTHKLAPPGL